MPSLLIERSIKADQGPYDQLYRSRLFLWPDRPGRMVRLAADTMIPHRALDVGCGDGKDVSFLASRGIHH
jgi:hypothetical protein